VSEAIETFAIASWFLGITTTAALAVRVALRRLLGSRVVYAFWCLPVVSTFVVLIAPRPEGPKVLLNEPALTDFQALSVPSDYTSYWLILLIWLCGFLVFTSLLWIGQVRFSKRLGDMIPLRVIQDIEVVSSATVDSPVAIGIFAKRIVLPDGFERLFTPLQQTQILEHELTHHARRDLLANLVAQMVRCVFWFHPLVHIACHYFRIDQELAADDCVLRDGGAAERDAYGSALVYAASAESPFGTGWASTRRVLAQRIRNLGTKTTSRARLLCGSTFIAGIVACFGSVAWQSAPSSSPIFIDAQHFTRWLPHLTNEELARNVMYGVLADDRNLVQDLLAHNASTEFVQRGKGTPLIMAARQGNLPMVEILVKNHADTNAAVTTAGSPLIMAAKHNHNSVANYLITHGSDVNLHVFFDETPLINAARFGHVEMVKTLVDAGAEIHKSVTTFSVTHLPLGTKSPISEAERVGHNKVIDLLQSY